MTDVLVGTALLLLAEVGYIWRDIKDHKEEAHDEHV